MQEGGVLSLQEVGFVWVINDPFYTFLNTNIAQCNLFSEYINTSRRESDRELIIRPGV